MRAWLLGRVQREGRMVHRLPVRFGQGDFKQVAANLRPKASKHSMLKNCLQSAATMIALLRQDLPPSVSEVQLHFYSTMAFVMMRGQSKIANQASDATRGCFRFRVLGAIVAPSVVRGANKRAISKFSNTCNVPGTRKHICFKNNSSPTTLGATNAGNRMRHVSVMTCAVSMVWANQFYPK